MVEDDATLCLKARQWHDVWKAHQGHGWGATPRLSIVGERADGELLFCLRDERGRLVHDGDCAFRSATEGA